MSDIFDLFNKIERSSISSEPVSFIIVGLSNIGKQYELTRHNAGFLAIDHIAEKYGAKIDRVKFHSTVGECNIGGKRVLLMKPSTLMNNSGVAVGEAAAFYKIPPERVLVLHDEISFDAGVIRIRRKGSAGGHNGLKSIIARLPGEDFPRIKIGIGKKPNPEYDLADWVLGKIPECDIKALKNRFDDIATASELIVKGDIDGAMARFSK
jgi:PTH1 family peptidyl-tRNA hydrolase